MKHLFKAFFAVSFFVAIIINALQIIVFLVLRLQGQDPSLNDFFNGISTAAQFLLFFVNILCLKYFFVRSDFVLYVRKTVRHEYLYLFLIIFLIRFCDLILLKSKTSAHYSVHVLYLVGVLAKHLTRLIILQIICFYKFREPGGDQDVMPTWKFLLYVSPNMADMIMNIVRLIIYYVYIMSANDPAPMNLAKSIVFVGDLLYLYYNALLLSGYLLKLKNPSKDVLRYVHKESNGTFEKRILMF